jgi:hypothetical protein
VVELSEQGLARTIELETLDLADHLPTAGRPSR